MLARRLQQILQLVAEGCVGRRALGVSRHKPCPLGSANANRSLPLSCQNSTAPSWMVRSSPLVMSALSVGSSASNAFSRSNAPRRSACRFWNVMTEWFKSRERSSGHLLAQPVPYQQQADRCHDQRDEGHRNNEQHLGPDAEPAEPRYHRHLFLGRALFGIGITEQICSRRRKLSTNALDWLDRVRASAAI